MRRSEKGIPILSWSLAVRNCESTLEVTLKSIRERTPQAEIVIVDNMSRDATMEIAAKYADVLVQWRGPHGDWDKDQPWTTDMSAARQKSFDLASGRWRAWIDSDDRLPGPEEAEQLLKLNARWQPKAKNFVPAEAAPKGLEDLLLEVEKLVPTADCIYAPYLYAREEGGQALIWQERERIIKWSNPPKWHWAEKAHEILVPVAGYTPTARIDFAHLLFIHEKKHDEKTNDFSTQRHFDVLHRQYLIPSERTTRRCLYLAAYSRTLCPEREREFIGAAHEAATTPTDRYRSLLLLGQLFVRQGFFTDALEAYAGATHLRPDLPDAWFQGGQSWMQCDDFLRAADWLEKGIACQSGMVESDVAPRFSVLRYPTILSEVYEKLGEIHRKAGFHEAAQAFLGKAVKLMEKVKESPSIGSDVKEANVRLFRIHNAYLAQANAVAVKNLAEYLINNDEPKKALELLARVPWNLQDHPLIVELEKRLRPVAKHLVNREAYNEFYAKDLETGYVHSPESWLEPKAALLRVHWAANWLNKNAPNATVLDVGCFDGIIGIPLLRMCPGIKYVGVDIYQKSIDKFRERVTLDEKLSQRNISLLRLDKISDLDKVGFFDVALWFEVIEHVPDPADELRKIISYVRPGGQVFVTTPWGSFDAGHPPANTDHGTPRDSRGHVRVLTARDTVEIFDQCDIATEDLTKFEVPIDGLGDGLHVQGTVHPKTDGKSLVPAVFVVPGALWDWNGRSVDQKGMGASEKSIVQVAGALAIDYRRVEVYGPVPNEDIYLGVRYWPKEQLRHVKNGKLIVSRSPGFAKIIDQTLDVPLKKILWLQDAYYPDLNVNVANDYEKIVVVSEWHKKAMNEYHNVPLDKMEVIYNPIDARLYTGATRPVRKNDRFVYCSSPDRGLIPLLRIWPRILERLPNATLDIYYGFRGCQKLAMGMDAAWTKRYQEVRREFEQRRYQKGITVRDMVSPAVLANTFLSSGIWFYPVSDFHETCCTAALEARASGCIPVCPPLAALAETAKCKQGMTIPTADQPDFEDAALSALVYASQVSEQERQAMSREAIEQYRIEAVLPKWKELLL